MIYRHDGPGGRIIHMSKEEPRCPGKPAGPSGYQHAEECDDCFRRITARAGYPVIEPPAQTPCQMKVVV